MSAGASLWTVLVPWLVLMWAFLRVSGRRGWTGGFVCGTAAAAVLMFPWCGHPLPFWIRTLMANFSVPLAGLLAVAVSGRVSGRSLFSTADWNAAWVFGAFAAVALYPSALGLGPRNFDAYALGWPWLFWGESVVLFAGVAVAAAALLWRGNRFGVLLLLALLAYSAGFQESENLWDYVLDPVFAAAALAGSLRGGIRRLFLKNRDGELQPERPS